MQTWLKVFCFTWFDVPGPKDSWDGDGFQPHLLNVLKVSFIAYNCTSFLRDWDWLMFDRSLTNHMSRQVPVTQVQVCWSTVEGEKSPNKWWTSRKFYECFPSTSREGFSPLVKDEIGVAQVNLAREGRWKFLRLDMLLLFQLKISIWMGLKNAQNISEDCSGSGWFWMMWVENYWRL